jgi:hypothetical protein
MSEDDVKPKPNYGIVGINLIVTIGYTALCRLSAGNAKGEDMWGSGLFLLMLIGVHMFTCIVIAGTSGKKEWLLSGLLVVLIGLSSCWIAFSF